MKCMDAWWCEICISHNSIHNAYDTRYIFTYSITNMHICTFTYMLYRLQLIPTILAMIDPVLHCVTLAVNRWRYVWLHSNICILQISLVIIYICRLLSALNALRRKSFNFMRNRYVHIHGVHSSTYNNAVCWYFRGTGWTRRWKVLKRNWKSFWLQE